MPSRILVVDDEPAVREVVSRALREAGYEVVAMNDGQAGLKPPRPQRCPTIWW